MRLFAPALVAIALCSRVVAEQTLKVLFVGNSQMMVCDLPGMIKQMAESAPPTNARIEVGRSLMGGATLKRHWDSGAAMKSMAAEHWDYVVLQELYLGKAPEFEDYASRFDEEIRKAGSKMILFATANASEFYSPALKYPESFKSLNDMQIIFGGKKGIPVAAAGYAWMKYLGPNPSVEQRLDLYAKDKGHPGAKGSYIYACLLYAVITQKSPEGLTNEIKGIHGGFVIPKEEAAKMQKAAWDQYREK
jgi:hypothetical protein